MTTAPVSRLVPILLVLVSALSILSTDLYAPSLPDLTVFFQTDTRSVQLTLVVNLAAFAVGQLIYGPLSDRYGRRPIILWSLVGFTLASIGCALSTSIQSLLLFRVLQGLVISAEAVIVLAVIRDLWDDTAGARIMAFYGMTIAAAPAAAPILGGYIHVWLGWQANFWLMAGLSLLGFWALYRALPESTTPDPLALVPARLAGSFGRLFRNRVFLAYSVLCGAMMGAVFGFIAEAPFILIERYNVPTEIYGYYYAAIVAAYAAGAWFAHGAVGRWGLITVTWIGVIQMLVAGSVLGGVVVSDVTTPATYTLPLMLFTFGMGQAFATSPLLAMGATREGKGLASALFGSLEMALAALGGLLAATLHDGGPSTTAIILTASGVLSLAALCVARWRPRPHPTVT
ncbi:MAG: multidrug effflux MFS transporter [Magnetospiraceae bacterium]